MTDFAEVLFEQRRLLINGPLDGPKADEWGATLMAFDGQSADPVTILITSPGGPLESMMPLLDVLDLMRAPVELTVLGRAHGSAGAFVAAAPGARVASPTASLTLRIERDRAPVADPVTAAAEDERLRSLLAERIAARSGQATDWVCGELDKGTLFPATEAIELGLVDRVGAEA